MQEKGKGNVVANMREIRFEVEELACNFCARRLLDALRAIDGVIAVHLLASSERVDGPDDLWGTVLVKYAPDFVEPHHLYDRVHQLGYALRPAPVP